MNSFTLITLFLLFDWLKVGTIIFVLSYFTFSLKRENLNELLSFILRHIFAITWSPKLFMMKTGFHGKNQHR